jgi:uncharacterized protein YodC (DUF2158 family)
VFVRCWGWTPPVRGDVREIEPSPYVLLTSQLHSDVVDQERTMQFSVGDIVYLIAYPSHRMTVIEVDGFEIACRWFQRAAVKEGIFPVHMIAKEARSETVEVIA